MPEQPEVLQLLRYARRFGVPVFNGSYLDWPHIASLELNVCLDAERDHEQILQANAVIRLNQAGQS